MSPWIQVADTWRRPVAPPPDLPPCNAAFFVKAEHGERTYPRAGVRRRAGRSVLIVWLKPGVPMMIPDLEGKRKYQYHLTDHQEAIDLGQMLANFERIGQGESR